VTRARLNLDVPALAARYRGGESVQSIARSLGVDASTVSTRLQGAGVALRGPREATAANLSRDPELRSRMGRRRSYPVDPDFFASWSPVVAYVVGLFQADGSNQVERGTVCITLKASDGPHLEALAREMGAVRPLIPNRAGGLTFSVQNRRLSQGLADWGVVSPKTFTASTDTRLLADADYWRGVVDGDGTVCEAADGRRILSLVGTEAMCAQFLEFCRVHSCGLRASVHRNRSIWTAKVSGDEASVMASVLYDRPGLALPRKAAVARRWRAP
jgi:hypothetical protein